jgi:hypothetical protein
MCLIISYTFFKKAESRYLKEAVGVPPFLKGVFFISFQKEGLLNELQFLHLYYLINERPFTSRGKQSLIHIMLPIFFPTFPLITPLFIL